MIAVCGTVSSMIQRGKFYSEAEGGKQEMDLDEEKSAKRGGMALSLLENRWKKLTIAVLALFALLILAVTAMAIIRILYT